MDGGDGSESGTRREDRGEWYRLAQRLSSSLPTCSWTHLHLWPSRACQTCAHRYQRRLFVRTPQESRDITGRCYVLSQNLTINEASEEDGGNWNFCEGRGRGHERFGYCQQGLAATFTKDYHYVVFGAPGAYNWKGTSGAMGFHVPQHRVQCVWNISFPTFSAGMVRVEQRNKTLVDMEVYDDGPYEVGDENLSDPDLVPVPANSYLGGCETTLCWSHLGPLGCFPKNFLLSPLHQLSSVFCSCVMIIMMMHSY